MECEHWTTRAVAEEAKVEAEKLAEEAEEWQDEKLAEEAEEWLRKKAEKEKQQDAEKPATSAFCSNCGAELTGGKFCAECDEQLSW